MAKDILQRISRAEIPHLMELLETEFPRSAPIYHWLRTQRTWERKVPGMHVEVLCPRGDWRDGTFVALSSGHMEDNGVHGLLFSRDEPRLHEALQHTQLVPWADVAMITYVTPTFAPVLTQIMRNKTARAFFEDQGHLFYCSAEQARNLEVPEVPPGVRVSRLTSSDVDVVCAQWPYYFAQYRPVICAMVQHNLSVGVYVTSPEGTESLASMALEADHGGVGMAQTLPEFRERGLATLAVGTLVRALGHADISPQFAVRLGNTASRNLIGKLGFTHPVMPISHFCFHGPRALEARRNNE